MIGLMPSFGCLANPAPEFVVAPASGASNVSSYTWSNVVLGKARSNKRVYVAISYSAGSNVTLNSITIAGVSAVRLNRARAASSAVNAEIWQADVPAGSGSVLCTWSSSVYGASIAIYAAYGLTSGAVYSTGQDYQTTSSTTITNTINTTTNTFVLTCCWFNTSTGTLSLTNAVDDTPSSTYGHFGHDFSPPNATGRVLTGSSSASVQPRLMATAVIQK